MYVFIKIGCLFVIFFQDANSQNCGLSSTSNLFEYRLIKNKYAEQGAWPWMVSIVKNASTGEQLPWCNGFLIDQINVLTTAHCFDGEIIDVSKYSAKLGDVDLRKGITSGIQKIVVHPGYKLGRYYDDIAMLTLEKPVDTETISPICLPTEDIASRDLSRMEITTAGWDYDEFDELSYMLKQFNKIPIITNSECNEIFYSKSRIFRIQFPLGIKKGIICTGYTEKTKDSCETDSGAPLMLKENGRWYAVGIISFGYRCGIVGYPTGNTKISDYLDWIQATMD